MARLEVRPIPNQPGRDQEATAAAVWKAHAAMALGRMMNSATAETHKGPQGGQKRAHFRELKGAHLLSTTSCRRHIHKQWRRLLASSLPYHTIADGVFKGREFAVYISVFYLGDSKIRGVRKLVSISTTLLANKKRGLWTKRAAKKRKKKGRGSERLDGGRIGSVRTQGVRYPSQDDNPVGDRGNNSAGRRSVRPPISRPLVFAMTLDRDRQLLI